MKQMPELENIEIISSNKAQSIVPGDTKMVRALFIRNGELAEGLFYVTVAPLLPVSGSPGGGIGYTFSFIGISAKKDEFKNMQGELTESIGSFSLSQSYVDNCLAQQAQSTQRILKARKTLSGTSDIIISSWENRNRVDDWNLWTSAILDGNKIH